ncbi:MAG TPA: hypothetical protein VIY72_02320, partial [Acidimicrobiales bacterium]
GSATDDPQADTHRLILTPTWPGTHADLTKLDETTREIALAISGLPPACQSLFQFGAGMVQSEAVRSTESAAGMTVALAGTAPAPTGAALFLDLVGG